MIQLDIIETYISLHYSECFFIGVKMETFWAYNQNSGELNHKPIGSDSGV